MDWKIDVADINTWLDDYKGERFHALICDPPYNLESIKKRYKGMSEESTGVVAERIKNRSDGMARLASGFMGQDWDTDVAFDSNLWRKIRNQMFPGAFGLAFSSTRTYHRLATAIESAGFIIHPMFGWIQASGFPKATNLSKGFSKRKEKELADIWFGYFYGLQAVNPSMEPVCFFQNPYEDDVKESIKTYGTGALNIEGSRYRSDYPHVINRFTSGMKPFGNGVGEEYETIETEDLWPKNILLEDTLEFLDEEKSKYFLSFKNYKYERKASTSEKDAGLLHLDDKTISDGRVKSIDNPYQRGQTIRKNIHPTNKPIELIRYLATLLLPPEHYAPRRLLVPFSGVSSEMIGASLAGWDFVQGVELKEEYASIGDARLEYWKNVNSND